MSASVSIHPLAGADPERIAAAFAAQGWDKPARQYRDYLQQQGDGTRLVFVAECDGEIAGYTGLVWISEYPPFQARNIPEIVDLNVLRLFQRRGIATALMEAAERQAARRSSLVGLGVGLSADYGPAQRLYVKRGYVPDGHGVWQNGRFPAHGERVQLGDDLALYLIKELGAAESGDPGADAAAANDPQFQSKLKEMQEILENL